MRAASHRAPPSPRDDVPVVPGLGPGGSGLWLSLPLPSACLSLLPGAFAQPGDTATNLIMKNSDAEAAGKMGVGIGEVVGGGEVGPSCLAPEVSLALDVTGAAASQDPSRRR